MRALLYNLIPPTCLLCGLTGSRHSSICAGCLAELPFVSVNSCSLCCASLPAPGICGECLNRPPPWTRTSAVLRYSFPVPHLIHRFKFQHDITTGQLLASLFARQALQFPRPDTLLAVPLSAGKLRRRGFNQATELARTLSRALDIPSLTRAIERHQRHELVQSTLHTRAERKKNVRGVFHVKHRYVGQIQSRHIAIIDDVMTSGATAEALSRVLLKNGARQVDIWILARA